MFRHSSDTITNNVAEQRRVRGLTQRQLADLVDVSKQTIYMMERGNYLPSLLLAFRLAKVLDVNISELFSYVPNQKKERWSS